MKLVMVLPLEMWSLLAVTQILILQALGSQNLPFVERPSAICATGLLHLHPFIYDLLCIGYNCKFFGWEWGKWNVSDRVKSEYPNSRFSLRMCISMMANEI